MKFDYRTRYFFPKNVVTLGHGLIFLGAVFLSMVHWIVGVVLITIGLFIVSVNYGLVINTTKKTFQEYVFVMGFNFGKKMPYKKIEYLYVTETKKSATMQLRAVSHDISYQEYHGYIRFAGDQKIHLVTSKKKQKVMTILERIANDLSLKIKDLAYED